jgi:2-methylcitrate dehydratase PrpD
MVIHSVGEAAREHSREFTSGALFGVAAAAGIAALQELLGMGRKKHP